LLYTDSGIMEKATRAYDRYEFHTIYHSLYNYCTVDLSSFYLDILKDRLYTSPPASQDRRSAQTVMYILLDSVAKIMAPILPFTSEEIWKFMPEKDSKEESIHLVSFAEPDDSWKDDELASKWEKLINVRGEVTKALELARAKKLIGHPLDAEVTISADKDLLEFLRGYEQELRSIFIVSKVSLVNEVTAGVDIYKSEEIEGLSIMVGNAPGEKCERCWIYDQTVGDAFEQPTICERCCTVLSEMG